PGTVWYSDNAFAFYNGYCINSEGEGAGQFTPGGVLPNQDIVVTRTFSRGVTAPDFPPDNSRQVFWPGCGSHTSVPVQPCYTVTWIQSIFVVPESPIGMIALFGSSFAALGGFFFWKRKSG